MLLRFLPQLFRPSRFFSSLWSSACHSVSSPCMDPTPQALPAPSSLVAVPQFPIGSIQRVCCFTLGTSENEQGLNCQRLCLDSSISLFPRHINRLYHLSRFSIIADLFFCPVLFAINSFASSFLCSPPHTQICSDE